MSWILQRHVLVVVAALVVAAGAPGCGGAPAAPGDSRGWSRQGEVDREAPLPVAWQEPFTTLPRDWESPSGASAEDIARVVQLGADGDGSFLQFRHDARPADGAEPPPAVHWGKAFREGPPPLADHCLLRWRWRVRQQPKRSDDPWLDVAASVYVMIRPPGLLSRGRGFKFGWLARSGPVGTHQRGLLQVQLRQQRAGTSWRREEVDLCKLYRRAYGALDEERILYVGIVTDADNTQSVAAADYDDFELLRTGAVPPEPPAGGAPSR